LFWFDSYDWRVVFNKQLYRKVGWIDSRPQLVTIERYNRGEAIRTRDQKYVSVG
jgi:hypothetical protein